MVRPLLLLVLCCLPQCAAGAAVIRSVRVTGAHARSERELLERIASRPGQQFSEEHLRTDLAAIEGRYHDDGFTFAAAAVDSLLFDKDSASVEILLSVREGDLCHLGAVAFDGRSALAEAAAREAMGLRPGSLFTSAALESDIGTLLSLYERIGYPFASVRVASIDAHAETATLDVRLHIDEGSRVEITEIRVEGNSATQDRVILREARMTLPELYDEEKLARISNRLRRLNLFSSVNEPRLLMSDHGGILVLGVAEGRTSTFDGIVGYSPGALPGEGGVVAGSVNVGLRNLFGTGRILNVRWQKDDRTSQDVRLQYVEPWLFDWPVNLGGAFAQRQQDTSYLRRVVELQTSVLLSESFSVGGSVGHEVTIPSAGAGPRPVGNSRTLTAGVEILYDTRNDMVSPTSGIYYHNAYLIGNKRVFGAAPGTPDASSALQRVSLDLQWYTSPVDRNVVLVGLHGRQLTNDRPEPSDLFRFGGTNTLRGYRELQFSGSRIAWTNLEYRALLAPRSFAFGFFDTGYYFLPEDPAVPASASAQSVKYGYGIGIRLETALGNVGVSFALGEGDGLSQGKIHFGLINEF